ncbi:hypothetical protein KQX54_017247 [Cotesia glomerata]|uniref:Uncharacterized protein n=1 Tax=Cotesia glomerata TaxID=32391 RepID=A0AAV7J2E3_COTGL|nr:hypothetical protein KQX54_017247 [Cotesia glomerata]
MSLTASSSQVAFILSTPEFLFHTDKDLERVRSTSGIRTATALLTTDYVHDIILLFPQLVFTGKGLKLHCDMHKWNLNRLLCSVLLQEHPRYVFHSN